MATYDFNVAANPLPSPWGTGTGWANLRAVSGECANAAGSDTDSMMRYTLSSSVRSIIEYRSGTFDGGPGFMDASGNAYLSTCFTGTTVQMYKVTGGPPNYTQLGTDAAVTFAAGDLAELRLTPTDVIFLKNGVTTFTQPDSTFRAGLNPAIFIFAANLRVDNWSDGLIDVVTGIPIYMIPGPGFPIDRRTYFLPQRFAATNMLADTSLQAVLASGSELISDLTTSSRLGNVLGSGPGISPNYMTLFNPQRFAATNMANDTSLAATLASSSTLTAALTTAIPLAAALASVSSVTAALTTAIPLSATLSSSSTITAALSTQIRFAASLTSVSSLTAALTTAIPLTATLSSASALTASLSTAIPLVASLTSVTTLTAQLAGTGAALAATLSSASALTASITTAIPLSAALASVSTITANLTAGSGLQASLASTSTLTASLTTAIRMQSALASTSTLTAAFSTQIRFAATLGSVCTLSATLGNAAAALQASLASTSTLTASLSTQIRFAAALASNSTFSATLTGGAAELVATLQSLSALTGDLTSTVRLQPSGIGLYDPMEGQFASRRAPFVSMTAGPGRLIAGESYGVAIGRFAWADDAGIVRTIRTGDQRLGFVRQVFGPRRAIYVANGLRWIRQGLPVSLYVRGEFWARFNGGALAGDTVYVSLLDGSPISGYAADALPSQWRVAMSAFPGELAVITTWE